MGACRPLGLVLRDLLPPAGPRALMPARVLIDLAALADRRGYDSAWFPEGTGRELTTMLGAATLADLSGGGSSSGWEWGTRTSSARRLARGTGGRWRRSASTSRSSGRR